MRYVSTRGQAPEQDFAGVLLAASPAMAGFTCPPPGRASPPPNCARCGACLCRTGGQGHRPLRRRRHRFETLAGHVPRAPMRASPTRPPRRWCSSTRDLWALELFHGPTLAFKDMALQLLGQLFEHVLTERDESVTHRRRHLRRHRLRRHRGLAGRARINIAILHPEGRTSEVQRRQMTTVQAANVCNIAVDGQFRRLPGSGEGDVRRRAVPRRDEPLGGELDQLGPHRRADSVLRRRRAGPRRAGPRGGVRRAHRQFRQCAGRLGRPAHGPADRASSSSAPTATISWPASWPPTT